MMFPKFFLNLSLSNFFSVLESQSLHVSGLISSAKTISVSSVSLFQIFPYSILKSTSFMPIPLNIPVNKSLIIDEVIKAANSGCLVLGICNGFQILTETGLLKGTLLRNKNLKFINKDIHIQVINNDTKFSNKYKKDQILKINIAHNEGNYFTDSEHLQKMKDENLIAFKYCDENGNQNKNSNPNGSLDDIAGIFNSNKNILGMMPHPERMVDQMISNKDGENLFTSLLN